MALWLEVCSYLLWALFIAVSVYGNIRLWSFKQEPFIQKRSISSVFGLNATFICLMISSLFEQILSTHRFSANNEWILLSSSLVTFTAFWFLLFFLNTTNWLLFYKIKWTYFTFKYKWQRIINKDVISIKNEKNWYIVNNTKYGNPMYVKKGVAIYCLVGLLVCSVTMWWLSVTDTFAGVTLIILSILPPFLTYTVITCKIPCFADSFWIRGESIMRSRLILLFVIFQPVLHGVGTAVEHTFAVYMAGYPLIGFVLFLMNYTSTFSIIKKNVQTLNCLLLADVHSKRNRKLEDILSDATAIQLFMEHLSKEYSMECLLSFIEFNQFQFWLQHNDKERGILENEIKVIVFPDNVPISEIIEEQEPNMNEVEVNDKFVYLAKIKAYKIFQKYIKSGAEFECNIPYQQKNDLYAVLGRFEMLLSHNVNVNDLFVLFESCKNEMLLLLTYSFTRFKNKDEFNKIELDQP